MDDFANRTHIGCYMEDEYPKIHDSVIKYTCGKEDKRIIDYGLQEFVPNNATAFIYEQVKSKQVEEGGKVFEDISFAYSSNLDGGLVDYSFAENVIVPNVQEVEKPRTEESVISYAWGPKEIEKALIDYGLRDRKTPPVQCNVNDDTSTIVANNLENYETQEKNQFLFSWDSNVDNLIIDNSVTDSSVIQSITDIESGKILPENIISAVWIVSYENESEENPESAENEEMETSKLDETDEISLGSTALQATIEQDSDIGTVGSENEIQTAGLAETNSILFNLLVRKAAGQRSPDVTRVGRETELEATKIDETDGISMGSFVRTAAKNGADATLESEKEIITLNDSDDISVGSLDRTAAVKQGSDIVTVGTEKEIITLNNSDDISVGSLDRTAAVKQGSDIVTVGTEKEIITLNDSDDISVGSLDRTAAVKQGSDIVTVGTEKEIITLNDSDDISMGSFVRTAAKNGSDPATLKLEKEIILLDDSDDISLGSLVRTAAIKHGLEGNSGEVENLDLVEEDEIIEVIFVKGSKRKRRRKAEDTVNSVKNRRSKIVKRAMVDSGLKRFVCTNHKKKETEAVFVLREHAQKPILDFDYQEVILPILKTNLPPRHYEILEFDKGESGWSVKLKMTVCDVMAATKWFKSYKIFNKLKFRLSHSQKNSPMSVLTNRYYCWYKSQKLCDRNKNLPCCPASVKLTVLKRRDETLEFNCIVAIRHEHNHPVFLRYTRPQDIVRVKFAKMFKLGYRPCEAMQAYIEDMRCKHGDEKWKEMELDRSIAPDAGWVYKYYYNFIKQQTERVLTPVGDEESRVDMQESLKLAEKMEDAFKRCVLGRVTNNPLFLCGAGDEFCTALETIAEDVDMFAALRSFGRWQSKARGKSRKRKYPDDLYDDEDS